MADTLEFLDGFTVAIGDRVTVRSSRGTHGTGQVIGFRRDKVLIQMDEDTSYARYDRYPLRSGGTFDAIRDHGVSGGCLVRPE